MTAAVATTLMSEALRALQLEASDATKRRRAQQWRGAAKVLGVVLLLVAIAS